MRDIVIKAAYGDQDKEIVITRPFGAGDHLHLYIDNYFHSQILKVHGKWHIAEPRDLTTDDIQIIIELIEQIKKNS